MSLLNIKKKITSEQNENDGAATTDPSSVLEPSPLKVDVTKPRAAMKQKEIEVLDLSLSDKEVEDMKEEKSEGRGHLVSQSRSSSIEVERDDSIETDYLHVSIDGKGHILKDFTGDGKVFHSIDTSSELVELRIDGKSVT